jgi:hypothetical protein
MILLLCLPCGTGLRLNGNQGEVLALVGPMIGDWPDLNCPTCQKKLKGLFESQLAGEVDRLKIYDVTPQEAIAACHGLGFPVERACTIEEVNELLSTRAVKKIVGENIRGTTRCIVDHLVLSDETKIYLGASTDGATVYRITRPHSYVESIG